MLNPPTLWPALPPGTLARAEKIDFPALYEAAVVTWEKCYGNIKAVFNFYKTDAEAIAAAAKIYGDDRAPKIARNIKNAALLRMRELAEKMNPKKPAKVLRDLGLRHHEVQVSGLLHKMTPKKRKETGADSMSISSVILLNRNLTASESYQKITQERLNPWAGLPFIRQQDAKALARGLTFDEAAIMRAKTVQIQEWLDAFEQALPQAPRGRPLQTRAQITVRARARAKA